MTAAPPSFLKTWLIAVRPFAYTASICAVLLGFAMAASTGAQLHWGLFALTTIGVVCFHTGANLLNDVYDWRRGLDREAEAMSGAVVRGLLTERQVYRGALVFLAIGSGCGFILAWFAGWVVLLLGLIGATIAWGYTGPRFCFKYAGLGDGAIFLAFGALPVFGAWWVQTQAFSWSPILWSAPVVCYTVAILHSNNWRDIRTDPTQGCRTFAGVLGEKGSDYYYRFLMLGPFAMVAVLWVATPAPWTVWLAFGALPSAWKRAMVDTKKNRADFLALLARTAQANLVFGVLLSAGFFWGRFL